MRNKPIFFIPLTALFLIGCAQGNSSSSALSSEGTSSAPIPSSSQVVPPTPAVSSSLPVEESSLAPLPSSVPTPIVSSEQTSSAEESSEPLPSSEQTSSAEESSEPLASSEGESSISAETSIAPLPSSEEESSAEPVVSSEEESSIPEESSEPIPSSEEESSMEESSFPEVSSSEPLPSSEEPTSSRKRETFDGIKVYCDTSWDHIYAWDGKTQYCGAWPGANLIDGGDWKYYEFPNIESLNLIFNRNGGSQQTRDLSLNKKGVYYYSNDKWYPDDPAYLTSSSTQDSLPPVSDNNYMTFYQLLVYSFADGNGDGIGDFKGIIDHLDYLDDLGIKALWLSPVQSSESYHSYDCTDYYTIKSQYEVTVKGVKYDIDKLLEACHAKGIKVVMDMVLNHTSSKHVWVSQHPDWYGKDNKFGFPEFDFDKQVVREAIKDVGKYWLGKGVDGFRLDAAYWIYNSGYDRDEKNFEWWQEFSSAMKETNPDCYLVGEVLDENHDLAFDYTSCGFDSTFDFEAPKQTYLAFNGQADTFASSIIADQKKIDARNPNAIMARALSNHDIGRFSQDHPFSSDTPYAIENPTQYKAAIALNALTPGNAFIYYGDELGLKASADGYTDQNYRTPMPFESGLTDSTVYFEDFHGTGASTWSTLSGKTISEDQADPYSAYSVLKKAIAIKETSPILQRGRVEETTKLKKVVDYKITYNKESVHFYCNGSTSTQQVEVSGILGQTIELSATGKPSLSGNTLTLPAGSIAFIIED